MLLPRPASVTWGEGEFVLAEEMAVSWTVAEAGAAAGGGASEVGDTSSDAVQWISEHLADNLSQRTGLAIGVRREGAIELVLDPGAGGNGRPQDLPATAEEAYRLTVTPQAVRLAASAPVGLFRGLQTLLQLLPEVEPREASTVARDRGRSLPAVTIDDRPRFRWRGLHLDVARHFFSASQVREAIDWCAWHKLNVFHWHLVDDQGWRMPVARYPRLTEVGAWRRGEDGGRYGGAYTAAEVRAVVEYAARRFVTVVPEIEMPGHARAALAAYPSLSCRGVPLPLPSSWGIFEDVFCAGNEETFAFLEAVLDEVAESFPGPFVHIGGDECPKARWNDCPECRARMEEERLPNTDALQAWFVSRIGRYLRRRGKRMVGWDEILDGLGSDAGIALPADAVVMSWRGFEGGVRAARAGHDVVMSPVGYCYLDHYQGPRDSEPRAFPADLPLQQVCRFDPIPPGLESADAARILGGQGNTWTEWMIGWDQVSYMVFPRLCALAEALWSPAGTAVSSDFPDRLRTHARRLERLGIRHGKLG
jgi:hexosaminidase